MPKLHSEIDSYFRGILHAVFLVLLRSGLSKQAAAAISNVAQTAALEQLRTKSPENPRLSVVVGSALHAWHHRRIYLNVRGKPRALSLHRGPISVAALIRSEDRQVDVSEVIAAMKRLDLLKKTKGGLFRPTGRFATIAQLDPVLAEHVCHSLGRLLATVSYNTRKTKDDARMIERSAQVQDLPRSRLDEFRDFANAQGELFVSTINDWLESRRASGGRRARKSIARAGVHVFAFSEHAANSQNQRAAHL